MRILTANTLLVLLTTGVVTTYLSAARFDNLWGTPEDLDRLAIPKDASPSVSEPLAEVPPRLGGPKEPGQWESFADMHAHYTHNFVESEGFGMSRIMTFDEPSRRQLRIDDLAYSISQMYLVGLGGESPVVYESSWLGLMRNQLETYPTRTLTEFEADSLKRMSAGESLTWSVAPDTSETTLIGALRAEQSCMECHHVNEGELLGAFVYTMQKVDTVNSFSEFGIEPQSIPNAGL